MIPYSIPRLAAIALLFAGFFSIPDFWMAFGRKIFGWGSRRVGPQMLTMGIPWTLRLPTATFGRAMRKLPIACICDIANWGLSAG